MQNNRPFKFRAWTGKYLLYSDKHFLDQFWNFCLHSNPVCKVMQYIGLDDKYKVNIYEHDIVAGYDERFNQKFVGIVEFSDGSFCVDCDTIRHYRLMDYELTVLGNKYDNPELMDKIYD